MPNAAHNTPRLRARLLALFAVAACVGVAFLFPQPRWAGPGLWRGESFYRWLPSSYWRHTIVDAPPQSGVQVVYNSWIEKPRQWLGIGVPRPSAWGPLATGGDPAALPVLLELLRDEDKRVRRLACNGVNAIAYCARTEGRPAPSDLARAVPELMRLLADADEKNASEAIYPMLALGELGPQAKPALPLMSKWLQDRRPVIRLWAAKSMCNVDIELPEPRAVVVAALRDPDSILRHNAAEGLMTVLQIHGPEGLRVLQTKEPELRAAALEGLKLERAQRAPSPDTVSRLNQLLEKLGSPLKD